MRSSRLLLAAGIPLLVLAALLACSKKAAPPTAPPPSPTCSINPSSLDFGSLEIGATSSTKSFSITNSGGGTLSGTISESCPDFEIASGAGAYSLTAGQSRAVTARFHPQTAGNKSCTVGTGCSQGVTLTGVASTAPCEFSLASLNFGNVTVGQSSDINFTLRNIGSGTLSGTLTESCPDFAIVGMTSYTLAGGQSATFMTRFTPAQAGPQSCVIYTGSSGCPQISCIGTGVALNPGCMVSVTGLDFPQVAVGDRADATFTLTNSGSTAMVGTVTEDCPNFSIAGQASYNLTPNQSQSFIVRFSPTSLGEQTCEVHVGPGCPSVDCWGSGVTGCVYQPAAFDFGYVLPGESRCGSLTLTNNTSTLQQGGLLATRTAGAGYAGIIRADGVNITGIEVLPYTLNAGQSRTFTLCWTTESTTPCDSILGVWRIWSDKCPSVEATVRGIITKGCECSVTPTGLDFGNVVVGDTSPLKTVNIQNQSGIKGLTGAIRVITGDFVTVPSYGCCPPGFCAVSTNIGVSFKPTKLGPQTGKIVVENLAGCLGPRSGAVCDTVAATGVGVTAATSR